MINACFVNQKSCGNALMYPIEGLLDHFDEQDEVYFRGNHPMHKIMRSRRIVEFLTVSATLHQHSNPGLKALLFAYLSAILVAHAADSENSSPSENT
jgi:hypothetical protein